MILIAENRTLLIHPMLVCNHERAIYSFSGPRSICYVVDVKDISTTKLRNYLLVIMIDLVLCSGVEDIFNPGILMPSYVQDYSFFQNSDARVLHLSLATKLLYLARTTVEPLPCAKYIRPTVIRLWNELGKTETDTFSRQAVEVFLLRGGTKK